VGLLLALPATPARFVPLSPLFSATALDAIIGLERGMITESES
jgi:hypothetical protein